MQAALTTKQRPTPAKRIVLSKVILGNSLLGVLDTQRAIATQRDRGIYVTVKRTLPNKNG